MLFSALVFTGLVPISAQEPEEEIALQEFLFNLPLGYSLTPQVLDFFNQTGRATDFAWLEPAHHSLVLQTLRGHIIFRFDSSLAPLSMASTLRSRCEYFALGEEAVVQEAMNLKAVANFYNKKTALAPDGDRALADNAALASQLAPYADLFIIRAERWLENDLSSTLDTFLDNVRNVAAAARAASPNVRFQVWIGRSVAGDRLTVEALYRALSRLAEVSPEILDCFGIGRPDAWAEPQYGNNLLVQTQFFIRRRSFIRPQTPEPPQNFSAVPLGSSEILLTWTDASSDELGFLLKRGPIPGRPPSLVEGLVPCPGDTSYRDEVPSPGTFYYRLCAFNSQGLSAFSEQLAVNSLGGQANRPPRFEDLPSLSVHKGVPLNLRLSASDPDGDLLTYSLSVRPAGMLIDPASGTISWLPPASGRYFVSATVSDGQTADFLWIEIEVLEIS